MTSVLAVVNETIGAKALWLLFLWLASAIAGAYLSERKGYGERWGLASGLLLTVIGPIIWLVVPPRDLSKWKTVGPWGSKVKGQPGQAEVIEPKS